jgi:hypothetical protein
LQLILTFIILSIITLTVVLLIILSKNSRSGKVRQLAQDNNWQYQEFIDFSDAIKQANFGILNYSQNAVFRHFISADNEHFGLGFNSFDCRAIEPSGIHNSSIILFNLRLDTEFSNLHLSINRPSQDKDAFNDVSKQQSIRNQFRQQKLIPLANHQIPKAFLELFVKTSKFDIYANNPAQSYRFLQGVCSPPKDNKSLIHWFLAYPHLHIEISNGMLLAYQKNHLIEDTSLLTAMVAVAELAQILSQKDAGH